MARPFRIEYPDAWYHIMNRGRRGEDVVDPRKKGNGRLGHFRIVDKRKKFFEFNGPPDRGLFF
jgi:hypothetical protein